MNKWLIILLFTAINIKAQSRHAGKFAIHIDPENTILDERFNSTLEETPGHQFIRKIYYPETKQITHLITYNAIGQRIREGDYKEWYDDGTLFIEGQYKDNKKEGEWLFEQGKGIYVNDLREGRWIFRNDSNRIVRTANYSEGRLNGWTHYFNRMALAIDSIYYKNDTIEIKSPHEQFANEKTPEFKGGTAGFYKWLNKRIIYPKDAKKNYVEGKAIVRFTIDTNGKVIDIKVLRGLCSSIRANCYSLFGKMPDWTPGYQNGKAVKVTYSLPLTYRLD